MDPNIDRFVGGVDARVTMLEKRVTVIEREIKDELKALNGKIAKLNDSIVASKSSKEAIAWFVGILGAAAALLTTLYHIGAIR